MLRKIEFNKMDYTIDDELFDIYEKYYNNILQNIQSDDTPSFLSTDLQFLQDITAHYLRIRKALIDELSSEHMANQVQMEIPRSHLEKEVKRIFNLRWALEYQPLY